MNIAQLKNSIRPWIPNGILDLKKRYEKLQFKGEGVTCNICGSSFRSFAPYGKIKRLNAKCLHCNSLERHRLLWYYLQEERAIFEQPIQLLHIAPEPYFLSRFAEHENISYFPGALIPREYQFGPHQVQKVDVTQIPFEDNTFDVILCNHVLEHVPDDALAMRELFRVMKKGGWGIFQVPIDYERETTYEDFSITSPNEREQAFGQFDHVRWYGRDYPNRLKEAGFSVSEFDLNQKFDQDQIFHFGFDPTEIIYLMEK